jgi:hypothetical protein
VLVWFTGAFSNQPDGTSGSTVDRWALEPNATRWVGAALAPSQITMNTPTPSHEEVTQRAQEIWRERGSPEGQDTEIWLEAERQLSSKISTTPAAKGPAVSNAGARADGGANVAAPAAAQMNEQSMSTAPAAKSEARKKAARLPKSANKVR